jgi:hypothetical protein
MIACSVLKRLTGDSYWAIGNENARVIEAPVKGNG